MLKRMFKAYRDLGALTRCMAGTQYIAFDRVHTLEYEYIDQAYVSQAHKSCGKTAEDVQKNCADFLACRCPDEINQLVGYVVDGTIMNVIFGKTDHQKYTFLCFSCLKVNVAIRVASTYELSELYAIGLKAILAIKQYRSGERLLISDLNNQNRNDYDYSHRSPQLIVGMVDCEYCEKLYDAYRKLDIILDDIDKIMVRQPEHWNYEISFIRRSSLCSIHTHRLEGISNWTQDDCLVNIIKCVSVHIPLSWKKLAKHIVEGRINWHGLMIAPDKTLNIRVQYVQSGITYIRKIKGDYMRSFTTRNKLYKSMLRDIDNTSKINDYLKNLKSPIILTKDVENKKLIRVSYMDGLNIRQHKFSLESTPDWHEVFYAQLLETVKPSIPRSSASCSMPEMELPPLISSVFFGEDQVERVGIFRITNFDENSMITEFDIHGLARIHIPNNKIVIQLEPVHDFPHTSDGWSRAAFILGKCYDQNHKYMISANPIHKDSYELAMKTYDTIGGTRYIH